MVNQGDIVITDFDPSFGSEQKGKRPALIISNKDFHHYTNGFVIALPITMTSSEGYPLHVPLVGTKQIKGEIMCEQIKTLDTKARRLHVVDHLPNDIFERVIKIVKLMF